MVFPSPKSGLETLSDIIDFHESANFIMPKVIACTGESAQERKDECIQAGFTEFVEKPVDQHVLKDVLEKYLN